VGNRFLQKGEAGIPVEGLRGQRKVERKSEEQKGKPSVYVRVRHITRFELGEERKKVQEGLK